MNVYIGGAKDYSAVQGPAPSGFHVPLKTEWEGLKTIMTGLGLTTGDSWRINLHIPFAGFRSYYDATVNTQGSDARLWSSTPSGSYAANYAFLNSSVANVGSYRRSDGLSIRCFKNGFETPTSSWTVINGTLGGAGIFRDTVNGLISITSDGTTGYTIQDKNLGATTVYNNGNTLSEANCGKYYQWGNNYGFAWTGSITTSTTQVNASTYGPGNYYSSSTFINQNNDWSSVQNDNLRGGVTGVVPAEINNAYIGEAPYEGNELCFTANTANSTVQLTKTGSPTSVTLETSSNGRSWSTYTIGDTITLSNVGDKVYLRNTSGTDTGFSTGWGNYYKFVMTGSISASGDINYLLNKNSTDTLSSSCFIRLFQGCSVLSTAPELKSLTLKSNCYYYMFQGCSNLLETPELPATTLAESCYNAMFRGCTNLFKISKLPATTLANYCYQQMFYQCTNLDKLPELKAISLTTSCYNEMFYGCTKIKLSTTQTGAYQTAYRIPTTGTGTVSSYSLTSMFASTGGTYTSDPTINTTYYTSNIVV